MATPDALAIYYDRWHVLDSIMHESIQLYETMDAERLPRKATILHLLKRLRAFAKGQFEFFYHGFDSKIQAKRSKPDRPILQRWDEFPPEDILTGLLDQVANDLELIQRAAHQRLSGGQLMQHGLANGDKLVGLALQPAIDYGVIDENTTVLTYFQKSADFYSIPYAKVALVGIPFTCAAPDTHRDFLAIPHEAGHYVYRNPIGDAKVKLEALRTSLDQVTAEYRDWIKAIFEEMCADIYGCLVGGPVIAADFQDLLLAHSQADFLDGDNRHPNAALRPLIYCQILASPEAAKLVKGNWRPSSIALSQHWKTQLYLRHVSDFVINQSRQDGPRQIITGVVHPVTEAIAYVPPLDTKAGQELGKSSNAATMASAPQPDATASQQLGTLGDEVEKVVTELVSVIVDYVTNAKPGSDPGNLLGWADEIDENTPTQPADLFSRYEKYIKDRLADVKLDPREAQESRGWSWEKWVKGEYPNVKWPPPGPIPSGDVKNPVKEPDQVAWGNILFADGWTTAGPGPDAGHPAE